MKIPTDYTALELDQLRKQFTKVSYKLSMKHGIIIQAMQEYTPNTVPKKVLRLYFQITGCETEFESLNDLKKALKNKAFI